MCMTAFVMGSQSINAVDNFGELRCAIGISPIMASEFPGTPTDDECLCNVDWEATAEKCGYTLKMDRGDVLLIDKVKP